eukprot:6212196-Pleurochrysis_carterae.AAC.1
MCYDPLSKRVYVSPHARIIETELLGLSQAISPASKLHSLNVYIPPLPTLPEVADQDDATGDAKAYPPGDGDNNPEQENLGAADDGDTIAQRLLRHKRMPAATVASDLLAEPVVPSSTYHPRRLQEKRHRAQPGSRRYVASRVAELSSDTLCVAVVAPPPCSTWSAAEPGDPQVLRTSEHPMGVPQKDEGLPATVIRANAIVINCVLVAMAAHKRGGNFTFKSPVSRGAKSRFAIEGKAEHVDGSLTTK